MSSIRSHLDPTLAAINTLENDPSVANIKHRQFNSFFNFKNTNENEVHKTATHLSFCKTWQSSGITTKIIKLIHRDLFSFICQLFNYCISVGEFSNEFRNVCVMPVHIIKDRY